MTSAETPFQAAASDIDKAFEQALTCHQAGQLQEAENLYLTILNAHPNHPNTNHNLGVLAVQSKQPTAGLPYFMAALDADPARGQYWVSYIDALMQAGQLEDAQNVLALAQQQGLQGADVEALAVRLEGVKQITGHPNAKSLPALQESQPILAAAQHSSTKPKNSKTNIPKMSAKKSSTQQGGCPTTQEINALVTVFNQGGLTEAAAIAQTMTVRFPQHWVGWKMLGVVYNQLGRHADALLPMQKTVALLPNDAEAHNNLGTTLQYLGRMKDAVASYRRALIINPGYAQAHGNLGTILQSLGRPDEAETSYRKALQINPNYAKFHCNLGAVLQDLGHLDEAVTSYRQALQINPDYAEAHSNLGTALKLLGKLSEAEASYRRALQINPNFAEAYSNLGITLHDLGRLEEAEASYRRGLELTPNSAETHWALGFILHKLGRLGEAEACYRRALCIHPDHVNALSNLGAALQSLGRLEEAVSSCRQALQINPDLAEAVSNLAGALHDLGRLDEATDSYKRTLQLNPDLAEVHSNLLFCLSQHTTLDAETLFAEHLRFGSQFESPLLAHRLPHTNSRDPNRRLQIGFVSGDLRDHAVAYFIEPVLKHLSGYPQLSLHAYSNHSMDDRLTERLRGYFAHWHPIASLSDAALAEKVRADHIDILIDLSGHTAKNRLLTFARKPAPVQATWMGYPGTTGLSAMDYYFSDRNLLPPGLFDDQFTEKIVRLPASAPFLPSQDAPPVNALPALGNAHVTFGSFNRLSKLSPGVIALWSQLLRALPDSRMVLGGMPADGKYEMLIEWFAQEGIARERLDFHPRSSMSSYLMLHQQVDICLDTFPYNGGTTTLNALWMGVPTLTLAGSTTAGRSGASILAHVGLEAFVASDAADFVRKGLFWAADLNALSDIRTGSRERFTQSTPGHPELITAGLERALRIMWQRWCADLPVQSFEVTTQNAISASHETNAALPQHTASLAGEQALQRAIAQHQAGQLQEAGDLYRAILSAHPNHPEANHNMGVLAVQMKQPAAGLPYFMAALDADPARGQYWLSYIDALWHADQLDAAREVLALAQQQGLQGDDVDALAARLAGDAPVAEASSTKDQTTLKETRPASAATAQQNAKAPSPKEMDTLVSLFNEGRYTEAATLAQAMTVHFPKNEFGWKALGAVFKQMGRTADALAPMQTAARLSPDDVETHYNLGVTFQELGRLGEAETSYRRALKLQPGYTDAHCNLGITLQKLGRLDEAEASFRRALKRQPDNAATHSNLGVILHESGRFEEAEACYRRALKINPNNAEAHSNLGNTLLKMDRLEEAEASYRCALQIKPDFADAHFNLGNTLKDMFRQSEAEASYRRALQFSPDNALTYSNMGALLNDLGRLEEAEACYRRALAIKPEYAEAFKNLGATLENQGHFIEAKDCYRKSWKLGFKGARIQEALMLPAIMGTMDEMLESRRRFERNLDELIAEKVTIEDPLSAVGATNFYLAYQGLNDRDLQVKLAKFYEQACPSLLYTAPHCRAPKVRTHKKIRVGFLSRFFSSHSVSLCFSKIVEVMSLKEQFEVALISHHPIDEKIYAKSAGKRVRLPNNLVLAREKIAELELDILIYLDIGMEPLSYFLAFSRLAHAQCVLGGHPVTTGIRNMDYFLSAVVMEPLNGEEHYSEKLIRLSRPLIYFVRPALPAVLKTRHELHLPDEKHIYMCPMKLQKIHPDFDAAMARILQLDSNGAVVLFEDDTWPYWKDALTKRLEKSIPTDIRERIIFLPWLRSSVDFISAIATADVVLDPFNFGIGSTAAMTSVTGTPLVTKAGKFMRGRVGAGYCQMLDVTECITEDTESYARKAVEIASDHLLREKISAKILENNSVLYENLQPVEDFVDFIHTLADSWHTA